MSLKEDQAEAARLSAKRLTTIGPRAVLWDDLRVQALLAYEEAKSAHHNSRGQASFEAVAIERIRALLLKLETV